MIQDQVEQRRCTDGRGVKHDHEADGYTVLMPQARVAIASCRAHAEEVITEYREKLDWEVVFAANWSAVEALRRERIAV